MILLGAPGAGKGTQAKLIAKKFQLAHIATGDLLRDSVAKETTLGVQAKEYMDKGELVPDQLVIDMIKERLTQSDALNGYILDGFPRTLQQAEKMIEVEDVDVVLNIDVDFNLLLERLTGRRSCSRCGEVFHIKYNPPTTENICDKCGAQLTQRADDKEEVIRNRLETYNNQTKPLIQFYKQRNILKNIRGSGTIEEIFENIVSALEEFK